MESENRVVVLIDMDCFYCQVEEKLDPELKGKPIAVVQYNPWKGGGIIAVNYVARAMGVTRHMRGDEAKEKCPEIELPSVPCLRGKADISKYRDAGKEVARVLQKFTPLLERASIDEAYLDITAPVQDRLKTFNTNTVCADMIPNTYALGYNNIEEFISDVHSYGSDSIEFDYEHARRLLVGAVIVSEIRLAVFEETGYSCSAGISHNKILAKLVCGMNKPNKQTVLPKHSINILYKTLSVKKVKHLGGKFGDTVCEVLKISKMGELQRFTERELQSRFDEKNGTWLYNIARGIDLEPVQARFNPKSIGCCKQLRGKSALNDLDSLRKWLRDLGDEIEDRLEKDAVENNRTPKQMVVSFSVQGPDRRDASSSRSYNFLADDELSGELFSNKALELVLDSLEGVKYTGEENNRRLRSPIVFLGISVGKFEDHSESKKTKKILDYFSAETRIKDDTKKNTIKESNNKDVRTTEGKEYIFRKFFNAQAEKAENNIIKSKDELDAKDIKDYKESYMVLESPLDKQESFFAKFPIAEEKQNSKDSDTILESPLDKQESFFAKFLSKTTKKNSGDKTATAESRSVTQTSNILNCDNSNDTNHSGSTINIEINNSIALFEEDADDTARVSNMRALLNSSTQVQDNSRSSKSSDELQTEETKNMSKRSKKNTPSPLKGETFRCSECGKTLPLKMLATHRDYHFALTLREEERRRVRDERTRSKPLVTITKEVMKKKKDSTEGTKKKKEVTKNVSTAPIASFFAKVDDSVPVEVCSECGKKIPVEKLTEHSDFHEAQKLSRVLNNTRTSTLSGVYRENAVRRKRKTSISPTKKPKLSCPSKSIDSFFR